MALETGTEKRWFKALATVASHCVQNGGMVLLEIATNINTSCSINASKIYVKVEIFDCRNAFRLKHCKLVNAFTESNCRVMCQCKEDLQCHLLIETGSEEHINIFEISVIDTLE